MFPQPFGTVVVGIWCSVGVGADARVPLERAMGSVFLMPINFPFRAHNRTNCSMLSKQGIALC